MQAVIFFKKILFTFLLVSAVIPIQAQIPNIAIDEDYEDWTSVKSGYDDGQDITDGIDLFSFKVANDKSNLYIYCQLGNEINLVNNIFSQDLLLHFDLDANSQTGQQIQENYGIELSIDFLAREAYYYSGTNTVTLYFGDLGFLSAPTVSTFEFEISIDLKTRVNGNNIFNTDSIGILFQEKNDGDIMPNKGDVFYYSFKENVQTAYEPIKIEKTNNYEIRVITYNVLFNSGWAGAEKLKNLRSVAKAINGDIYAFQESRSTSSAEAIDYFNTWLPIDNATWHAKNSSDLVTVSKWPILESWTFNRHLVTLIDLPEEYGTDLLVVNNHLPCCSNNSGRQDQVDEFCSFVRDAKSKGGEIDLELNTPIIYLGDFNLVGFKQQVETIMTGDIQNTSKHGQPFLPDWDETGLADAKPYHADENKVYTWRSFSNNRIYPPGRLDYQFYTDSRLESKKSFVLNTATMSTDRLAKYGLDAEDTDLAADHLPVVVDYNVLDKPTGHSNWNNTEVELFPNPAKDYVNILVHNPIISLKIVDVMGRVYQITNYDNMPIDVSMLNKGVYFLEISVGGDSYFKKLIIE
ncbi:MAG: T9SS type A sorting domain-containing protein [Bacteroidia bacterium]